MESHEKITFTELKIKKLDSDVAEKKRQKIIRMASKEREILELGTTAFVSFVQAYLKHDIQIVCKLKDLNIVGLAHSYGLLRLPKMHELNGMKLDEFRRTDIETSKIPYANKKKEEARQRLLEDRKNVKQPEKVSHI